MDDLPKDERAMLELAHGLVGLDANCSMHEITAPDGSVAERYVEVDGDGGVLQLWRDETGRWMSRQEIDALDDDGLDMSWVDEPLPVPGEHRLAWLLAWAAGIHNALNGQPDRMAFLRYRVECGVCRG